MALTEEQAAAIVTVVGNDPDCQKVLQRGSAAPSSNRGAIRNAILLLVFGKDPKKNPEIEPYVCTGVARITAEALNKVMLAEKKAKKPKSCRKLPFLHYAKESQERESPVFHTATAVTLTDGKVYVFDWHATLALFNPMIYPSEGAFLNKQGGVLYGDFTGWD